LGRKPPKNHRALLPIRALNPRRNRRNHRIVFRRLILMLLICEKSNRGGKGRMQIEIFRFVPGITPGDAESIR